MTPTKEQEQIVTAAFTNRKRNLLVNARAGAAKTTTIGLIAEKFAVELPKATICCVAFNKKTAEKMKLDMPSNTEAFTLNSIGNTAWRNFIGRWPKVNKDKMYQILKSLVDELPSDEKGEAYEGFSEIQEALRAAKTEGYMPGKLHPAARPLISDESFFDSLDVELSDLQRSLVNSALRLSFKAAIGGDVDFDDQIYCSAIMPVSFEHYDLVMVDEAQDLSPINHILVGKMCKRTQLIAVGDPCQAIYGFRGAADNSMALLGTQFDMEEHYLTLCFRSSRAVVRNARWRAPDMCWREDAPEGLVQTLDKWTAEQLQNGDAIICRDNAPLFRAAVRLLRARLYPEIIGGDAMKTITKVMRKLGKLSITRSEAFESLALWEESARKKYKRASRVDDMMECIELFLEEAETLGEAIATLEDILNRSGHIKLMTGHKAKGLEYDRVFFLDRYLLQKKGQDLNVRYVIETRAKQELYYVESSGWS